PETSPSGLVALSLAAGAQQPMPVVGYLSAGSPDSLAANLATFRRGVAENGFIEGQDMTIEYRWSIDQPNRHPALRPTWSDARSPSCMLSQMLRRMQPNRQPPTFRWRSASSPVSIGRIPTLLGSFVSQRAAAKRLELLRETVPNVPLGAFMVNPNNPRAQV